MIVCIAGMHRSGTSMVARLLNLCGVYLGKEEDLLQATEDNPEGYWENKHFLDVNLTILAKLNSAWDFPPRFDNVDWVHRPEFFNLVKKATDLVDEMNAFNKWGWKDPRNSFTFPFWQNILPDIKVVVCLRSPFDVQTSLAKRGYSSGLFGFHLWQAYNNSVLNFIPEENRIITHYESYFYDAPAELDRVFGFLGMDVDKKIIKSACESAKLSLRHNKSTVADLFTHTPKHVIKMYADLCALAGPVFKKSLQQKTESDLLVEDQKSAFARFTLTLADIEEMMVLREKLRQRDDENVRLNAHVEQLNVRAEQLKMHLTKQENAIANLLNLLRFTVNEEKSKLEMQLNGSEKLKNQTLSLFRFLKVALVRIFYFAKTRSKRLLLPTPKLFWGDWYLSRNTEIKKRGIDPYSHYLVYGWKERRPPNPFFDIDYYLDHNPDVALSNLNPLFDYLERGWKEGSNPGPFFDNSWYFLRNPDVKTEPLQQYLEQGWIENREPCEGFSAKVFFKTYPEFKKTGLDVLPLIRKLKILEMEENISMLSPQTDQHKT